MSLSVSGTQAGQASGSRRPVRAFTLIELLVVVAVIGILASLLMPTILSSMKSATTAHCQSNLRQIHLATMNYAKSNDMLIIPLGNYTTMFPHFDWWHFSLEPYIIDRNVYRCPALATADVGYGQNYRIVGGVNEVLSLFHYPQPLALIRKPSLSFIFCDAGYNTNPKEHPNKWIQGIDPWTGRITNGRGYCRFPLDCLHGVKYYISFETDPYRPMPRHPGHKTNCVYFDGHVAAIPTWDLVDEDYDEPNCLYDNN